LGKWGESPLQTYFEFSMHDREKSYNITIGFSTSRQPISKIIRWFTGSACTHAFIAFHDASLKMRVVLQAEAWGFELRPWKRWRKNNILVAEYEPAAYQLEESLLYIAKLLGANFDFRSAILLGIRYRLLRWFKTGFTLNPNYSPKKLVCSEAVIRFLLKGKYKTIKHLNPELTSPGELLGTVMESKEFKEIYLNKNYLIFDRKLKKRRIIS
jgi:hypothetical protein